MEDALIGIFSSAYEELCVADHDAAEATGITTNEEVRAIAEAAFKQTYEKLPDPELCGVVSDDARTFAALMAGSVELSPFAQDRLRWYKAGRIPCGYAGEYPAGRWQLL